MRQLRLVHLTEDGTSLLVETFDGIERFALPVDAVLRSALRQSDHSGDHSAGATAISPTAIRTLVAAADPAPQAESVASREPLAPREIQMRVRAGESPEDVAEASGVGIDSVLRFAAPVVAERARIADESRRARARRTSNESQVVVFGEAVDQRFEAHGISAGDVLWDSRRRDDGEWVVFATWHGGNDTYSAEWLFHRSSRSVTPADETAVDLLSDNPIRPVMPAAAAADHPARHKLREAPPLVPGVVSFPPMPDAYTGPVPVLEEVFDQEAEPEGPREVPPLHPADDHPTDVYPDVVTHDAGDRDLEADPGFIPGFDEQPLPLTLTGEPVPLASGPMRAAQSDAERAERARIPSWDDILLGVRRKSD